MTQWRDLTLGDILKGIGRYRPFVATIAALILLLVVLPSSRDGNDDPGGAAIAAAGTAAGTDAGTPLATGTSDGTGVTAADGTVGATSAGTSSGRGGAPGAAATSGGGNSAGYGAASLKSPAALAAPNCDPASGRVRIPSQYAPPCVRPWPGGDNGGATSPGVTADTIKVVVYIPTGNMATNTVLVGAGLSSTAAEYEALHRGIADLVSRQVELYGRKIEIIPFASTGSTPEAERADAISIATRIKPFAFMTTGPAGATAALEVAARGIVTLSQYSADETTLKQRAPHYYSAVWSIEHEVTAIGEYAGKRLWGGKARWAGDPVLQTQTRKLGLVYASEPALPGYMSKSTLELFSSELGKYGASLADRQGMTVDTNKTSEMQAQARTVIAHLKASGVNVVIPALSFVNVALLTKEATSQNYFPEWLVTMEGYLSTSVLAKTMDPAQWTHAYGVAADGPPLPAAQQQEGNALYRWHTGQDCPGADAFCVIGWMHFSTLARGVTLAGPRLTPTSFRDGLFADVPIGGAARGAVTVNVMAFGTHIWPTPSYSVGSDLTEIWWDTTADCIDLSGNPTRGCYRFVDGGRRSLVGHWGRGEPKMFDGNGSVTYFNQEPASDRVGPYPHRNWF